MCKLQGNPRPAYFEIASAAEKRHRKDAREEIKGAEKYFPHQPFLPNFALPYQPI